MTTTPNPQDSVVCQKGMLETCQQAAIAEAKGSLRGEVADHWTAISRECSLQDCPFNKLGRDARAKVAREESELQALQHEQEQSRIFGHAWGGIISG